jgi:UDP-N-acetylglucosamine--N-acetylmuramyl-(pentapeptide) pyrophosphoryl-undecaprenol N-acetylglucosamine transferase
MQYPFKKQNKKIILLTGKKDMTLYNSNAANGKQKPRMLIAGGGTGGHIFPALAIANAIRSMVPDAAILFIGAKGKMEMEKIPQAGYQISGIDIAGFNRSSMLKNLGLPFKLINSFFQVRKLIRDFKPDAVIGVGGYSSFPVLKYAQTRNIPTFIHESNSFAGKSNKLLGKNAAIVFVAGTGMEKFFPKEKIMITGNPVRKEIAGLNMLKQEAIGFFGLQPDKMTVLFIGGSLGAQSINEAVAKDIELFQKNNLQLIWQTGKPFAEKAKMFSAGCKNVFTADFIREMDRALAAADVVVSRAGAMAIAELSITGKPSIFVPYPFAAEDHQTVNANYLAANHAAMVIKNENAPEQLVPAVVALALDPVRQKSFSDQIKKLAAHDADLKIAKEILKYIHIA